MSHDRFETLIDLLSYRARVSGSKAAFTYQGIRCTFDELWQRVNCFAGFLKKLGLQRGECVLIALPNSAEFFHAFYGVQRAGGIAVPLFPGSGVARIHTFAGLCQARIVVVPSQVQIAALRENASDIDLRPVTLEEGLASAETISFPQIQPDDIAFLQYTSGSTGDPKGVMLTHNNLLTNIRQMIVGMEISEREIFVSWLPVYHDMGLILKTMVPFYLAAETHLLPTDLREARVWLETIQAHRATFTAAPDFAYRLVLSRVQSREYDLSSLRVALNAAEPVRATTIQQFEKRFGLEQVMTAGYGLAEATVGVSMSKPGKSPFVDERGIVSVGKPFPSVEIKITEGDNTLRAGQTGEIVIKSAANCKGYFNNPNATQELFKDGFVATGDMGYLDEDGQLYITGRRKNILKHLGRTVAPQEVEEIVDSLPGVRFSAAVGIDRGRIEGEQVYVFAEMRSDGPENDWEELTVKTVEKIYEHLGLRPARVVFLTPHGIPLTHNGKIQHLLLKENFLSRKLKDEDLILYPEY